VLKLWKHADEFREEERRLEMRWQLMMAQLAQPIQSKEAARDYQRTVQDLWRATESEGQKEVENEQSKEKFEDIMGFSFVRTGKPKDEPSSSDTSSDESP